MPPFRMPDDDRDRAGIAQHLRREVAGEGAGRLGVAILGADRDRRALHQRREGREQRRRRTNHQVDLRRDLAGARS